MSEPSPALLLDAEGLSKSYRMGQSRLQVLREVGLSLRGGEVCGLMRASGSGKSTLLNLLGLLDLPDQGEVRLDGRATSGLGMAARARLRARRIGFVFQQFHLLPELSALENVLMPRRLAGGGWLGRRRRERERAAAVLESVGLSGRLKHRPAQLSGGEQQRVAIARALVSEPALLLADEPTGNLDRATGQEVLALLLRLARARGAGVLLATHDPRVAEHCDRIVKLRDGAIVAPEAAAAEAQAPPLSEAPR